MPAPGTRSSRFVLATLAVVLALIARPSIGATQSATPRITVGPNNRLVPGEFEEPWIAASSSERNVLIAAAHPASNSVTGMDVITMISRDGGRSWSMAHLPGGTAGFDPMVASGPGGRLYVLAGQRSAHYWEWFATLAGVSPILKYPDTKPAHRVWTATGQAWSWDGPTEVPALIDPDHGRMVADLSAGPRRGRLYLVWNDAIDVLSPDQYELFLQYSEDGGKSFSGRIPVDVRQGGKLVATEPVVLSDGTLLVTYYQYFFAISPRRNDPWPFFVRRSTDGGKTFGPVESPFVMGPHTWPDPAAEFGGFILPIVVADSSAASPFRDHVYVTWDDVKDGESNVWLVRSSDQGRTWSRPIRINDNRPSGFVKDYRMKPTVAVNHRGTVAISWYDRRNDPTHQCWEYFMAVSTDGGATFGPNRPVSTAPSCPPPDLPPAVSVNNLSPPVDPDLPPDSVVARMSTVERTMTLGESLDRAARDEAAKGIPNARINVSFNPGRTLRIGDYSGLAADIDGVFHPLWIDRRNGAAELFTARITVGAPPRPAPAAETDVTSKVEIVAGSATFDRARGTVRVPLAIRNVSTAPVWGPITVRIMSTQAAGGRPTLAVVDSTIFRGPDSRISFEGRLGTENVLEPLDVSERIWLTLKTQAATGWDGSLDLRVFGRLSR